jgi:hypothetical protein
MKNYLIIMCAYSTIIVSASEIGCLTYRPKQLSEQKRMQIINESLRSCKIPCWQTYHEERYPRCPFTICNQKYDKTMQLLFDRQPKAVDSKPDPKQCAIHLIHKGYSCSNMYKILCPILNMSIGRSFGAYCAETYPYSVQVPYIGACSNTPGISYCLASTCCFTFSRTCDICIFNYLMQPDESDAELGHEIHDI